MRDCEIYAVLDKELLGERSIVTVAKRLIDNGVKIFQYRDKVSSRNKIVDICYGLKGAGAPILIINDYPDIAKEVGIRGVHLGQNDMALASAREILGRDKIIGRTTRNVKQAVEAEKQGADYVSIGPVFYTNTKKDLSPVGLDVVKEVVESLSIPVVAIGGIDEENINMVWDTGVKITAMASAILREDFPWARLKSQKEEILLKR